MAKRTGGAEPAGTSGGRMTKAQRKEAARLEREQLRRKIERQKRTRRIAIVAGIVVVALAIGAIVLLQPESDGRASADPKALLDQAPAATKAAGCGKVRATPPYDPPGQDAAHLGAGGPSEMPPLDTYASTPPASGPHSSVPLPAGVYDTPAPIDQTIHSLEHGAAIVWYDRTASGAELDRLKSFYDEQINAGAKVIVSPYDFPDQGAAGRLPNGAQMALVAWHQVQSCARLSLSASFDFVSRYSAPPLQGRNYIGSAPEPTAGI